MRIKGQVVQGKRLGRTIGFPTANIEPFALPERMPENGVYTAWLYLDGGKRRLACVLNQGRHPTVPEGPPTIEAHALDFSGDLYGQEAEAEYLEFLRPETAFASLEELKAQIGRDCARARAWFAANTEDAEG